MNKLAEGLDALVREEMEGGKDSYSGSTDSQNGIYSSSYVKKLLFRLALIALFSVCLVLALYFTNFNGSLSKSSADWGVFGDFVGGSLNPLLAFLSFVALLITLVMQSQQLELSRKELSATREELRRAAEAQEDAHGALLLQNQTQRRQQFENTFFSLLEQLNKVGDKVDNCINSNGSVKSKSILSRYVSVLRERNIDEIDKCMFEIQRSILSEQGFSNHYFKVLYQVLKFVSESESELGDESKTYSNIVRSLIPDYLLALLFFHCAVDEHHHYYNFKLMLEKYSFFEHLNWDYIFSRYSDELNSLLIRIYSRSAYGNSFFIHPVFFESTVESAEGN